VVVYVLSLAHALGAGTDASIPAVRYAMLASALPVLFLFALRLQRSGRRSGASRPEASRTNVPEVPGAAGREVGRAVPSGAPWTEGSTSQRPIARPRGQMEPSASQAT